MPWYCFTQNNSGGSFDFNEQDGITHHVVIEADDATEANYRAGRIGIYFNGCETGSDCPCCGDRWSEAWRDEGTPEPMVYNEPADKYTSHWGNGWMDDGKEIAVHPKNGPVRWYGVNQEAPQARR